MSSGRPPGPALVTAAADADPVTLLVTTWLSAGWSENTRTAYARDIGITPQRRASRAPSWLAWCQEQGVHPVTGVTGLHVARYARQLDAAGLSPASAARKLAAVSGWYAWLARRGHITASPAAGIARPRADPDTPPAPALTRDQALTLVHAADTAPGPQRARTAALVAVLLFTGARVSEVIGANVEDLGTEQGHRVLRVTRSKGRRQSLALPGPAASRIDAYLAGRPAVRRPGAVRHPDRGTAIRRRRVADRAPPRRAGRPASRPDQPPRTAHDAALIRGAVPRCRQVTPRSPERHGIRRPAHHPPVRPGPAHPRHPPSPASAAAPGTASAAGATASAPARTMASRQAPLPRPAPAACRQAHPAALITCREGTAALAGSPAPIRRLDRVADGERSRLASPCPPGNPGSPR